MWTVPNTFILESLNITRVHTTETKASQMEFLKTPDKKAILETMKTWKNIGQGET